MLYIRNEDHGKSRETVCRWTLLTEYATFWPVREEQGFALVTEAR